MYNDEIWPLFTIIGKKCISLLSLNIIQGLCLALASHGTLLFFNDVLTGL